MASIIAAGSNHPQAITQACALAASQGDLLAGAILYRPAIATGKVYGSPVGNAVIYGLLLADVANSASEQVVDVVVSGRIRESFANGARVAPLNHAEIANFRDIGIIIIVGD